MKPLKNSACFVAVVSIALIHQSCDSKESRLETDNREQNTKVSRSAESGNVPSSHSKSAETSEQAKVDDLNTQAILQTQKTIKKITDAKSVEQFAQVILPNDPTLVLNDDTYPVLRNQIQYLASLEGTSYAKIVSGIYGELAKTLTTEQLEASAMLLGRTFANDAALQPKVLGELPQGQLLRELVRTCGSINLENGNTEVLRASYLALPESRDRVFLSTRCTASILRNEGTDTAISFIDSLQTGNEVSGSIECVMSQMTKSTNPDAVIANRQYSEITQLVERKKDVLGPGLTKTIRFEIQTDSANMGKPSSK